MIIATDGLCKNNQAKGGQPGTWAFVVFKQNKFVGYKSGHSPSTTNNEMEALAVLKALEWLHRAGKPQVTILSDSSYVVKSVLEWSPGWVSRGWKNSKGEPVANQNIFKQILSLLYPGVKLEWVKGHSNNKYNEAADLRCNEEFFNRYM